MKILYIRHGRADYSIAESRRLSYIEKNFSPLDEESLRDIYALAGDERLGRAEVIISSPYTRSLQTAEIINRRLRLPLHVEFDLHEWKVDFDGEHVPDWVIVTRYREFQRRQGIAPESGDGKWETAASVRRRVRPVLRKYAHHDEIIVVAHGALIQSMTGNFRDVDLCGIVEQNYSDSGDRAGG